MNRWMRLGAVGLVLLAATGCGASEDRRTLDVLAAASLTDVFQSLAEEYERQHPDVTVRLVFDSSATLATQVQEGAPADVLATADLDTMDSVVDSGDVDEPAVFATNRMVLVTPAGDQVRIDDLTALERVDFVTCVETAPCGRLAAALLELNGVDAEPVSLEVDVRSVLSKVVAGEADAGLVYATDARSAGDDVRVVDVPGAAERPNPYSVAVTADADDPGLAQEWVDLVLSEEGQQVLRRAGFGSGGQP